MEILKLSMIDNIENDFTISAYKKPKIIRKVISIIEGGKKNINMSIHWKILGCAYALLGNINHCIKCYEKLVSSDPTNYKSWISLSFAYRSDGDILVSNWINYNVAHFIELHKVEGSKEVTKRIIEQYVSKMREQAYKEM